MPTVFGIVFFLLASFCFFVKSEWLFGLLIFASIFQASSAFDSGGRGVQPYYVIAPFVIARAFLERTPRTMDAQSFKGKSLLFLFGLIGMGSALILPVVFAGTPVYSPSLGLEEGFLFRPPLSLSSSNIVQASYLLIQVMVVWAAASLAGSSSKTYKAYIFTFYVLSIVIFAQLFCRVVGLSFPYSALESNPGYYMVDTSTDGRPPGTFAEPSLAGLAMAMFSAGFLFEYLAGRGGRWRVLTALIGVGVVSSSSSIIATIVITIFTVLRRNRGRASSRHSSHRTPQRAAKVLFIGVVGIALFFSPLKGTMVSQTVNKSGSDSFVKRLSADAYALDLAASTHGVGVGLGSNRPSSLLTSLLSNVGVIGTVVFFIMCARLLTNGAVHPRWISWAGAAVLIDMSLGVPDITCVSLWIVLALAVHFGSSRGEAALAAPQSQAATA